MHQSTYACKKINTFLRRDLKNKAALILSNCLNKLEKINCKVEFANLMMDTVENLDYVVCRKEVQLLEKPIDTREPCQLVVDQKIIKMEN